MSVVELRRTLARLADVPEPALRAACKAVEQFAASEGGFVRVGRNKRTYKLKAITRIQSRGTTITATVYGIPAGFWVWKTTGTDAHLIPKRPPTKARPRPMAGGLRHPVQRTQLRHPGASGRGAWDNVRKRAATVVPEMVEQHIRRVIAGA